MSESERRAAIKRAENKWCPRTRFIANKVPVPVMRWLIAHEEAIRVGGAIPPMPADVMLWFEDRGIAFADRGVDPGSVTEAEVDQLDVPGDVTLPCPVCGAPLQGKQRYCSTKCRVTAHRARAAE
jgi:hypothetical protein